MANKRNKKYNPKPKKVEVRVQHKPDNVEEYTAKFKSVVACLLITAHAMEIWDIKAREMAFNLGCCYNTDIKNALNNIESRTRGIEGDMETISRWGWNAALDDEGHQGDADAFESLQHDAGWVAALSGYTYNASADHPELLLQIESICKQMTKKTKIPYDIIESVKPTIIEKEEK